MKKILKNKKSLLSLCTILMAMALIAGATFAWFTVNGTAGEGSFVSGNLKVDYKLDMPTDPPDEGFQPGDFSLGELGYIRNTGTLPLFLQIDASVIANLKYEYGPNWNDDGHRGLVEVAPYVADPSLVLFGLNIPLVNEVGDMINKGFINNESFVSRFFEVDPGTGMLVYVGNDWPKTFHWVLRETPGDPDSPVVANFFAMDPTAEVLVNTVVDWYTNRKIIDNIYEDAKFDYALNLKGTQAAYDEAVLDVLGVDIDDLEWADVSIATGARSAAPAIRVTPADIIRYYFGR